MKKILLTVLLALATTAGASAQKLLEYGLTAGINIPEFSTSTDRTDVNSKLGWQAGVVIRINTPIVAIQPELLYVRQALDVQQSGADIRVKSNSLNMPILASLKLFRILHINVGPVFSLMNSCKYKYNGNTYDFGRLQPTMGYAVGAAVQLNRLMIDARFNGQFKSKQSINEHNIDVNVRSYSVAFSLAYLF